MQRFFMGLMFFAFSVQAQSLLKTFGTGTNQFSIDFVTIGNPGNSGDTTGVPGSVGAVGYTYNLGKYEISRDMITKANVSGNLGITLYDMTSFGGNGINRPATGISWYEAAKFVNWLNTSTGAAAAYKFSGSNFQVWSPTDQGYNANNPYRNSLAAFWLPNGDEWYKGAYGSPGGTWYNFPNGSDSAPNSISSGLLGAVYGQNSFAGPADVTDAGSLSAWGTMAQGGNVWEWVETAFDGVNNTAGENRYLRGGGWDNNSTTLDAANPSSNDPSFEFNYIGFRVAGVPEPSALSLLAVGFGMFLRRRRRTV